jgi:hypothetical protein
MAIRIQHRRSTASQWNSVNPVLNSAEIGYETDTGKFKIGNGSSAWNSLSYAGGISYATESYVDTQISNLVGEAPEVLDTLSELAAAINNDPNFLDNLDSLPSQEGNAGKYLTTDGAVASWAPVATETPHPFAVMG